MLLQHPNQKKKEIELWRFDSKLYQMPLFDYYYLFYINKKTSRLSSGIVLKSIFADNLYYKIDNNNIGGNISANNITVVISYETYIIATADKGPEHCESGYNKLIKKLYEDHTNYRGYVTFLRCIKPAGLSVPKDIRRLIFGFTFNVVDIKN